MNRATIYHAVLVLTIVLSTSGPARGQWGWGPNPWNPYMPWGGNGNGATLAGSAQVIQANGQLIQDQEQARIMREKANQEKLVTKRQAFDQAAYERANTPSWTEEQEKVMATQIRRVMTMPNNAEIRRGDTLNTLLPFLKAMSDQGVAGPPMPLNQSMLRGLNVRVGSGGAALSPGMLADGGRIAWPLALRGANSKKLDKLLPEAIAQAVAGTLEQPTYTSLVSTVLTMKEDVRKQYHKEQITGSTFLGASDFLDSLNASLKVLQQADAGKFFDGSYTARGGTVPELVDNMTANGLTFAPATPGIDAPYFSLHNSFVSYARAAQSGGGSMQSNLPPPPKAGRAPF
jgi:hypothetical protein